MRPVDVDRANYLAAKLIEFDQNHQHLAGVASDGRRTSLVRQMIDSIHRIDYVRRLGDRSIVPDRADPTSNLFDPLKAAVIHLQKGNPDEAAWLVFLSTHFGYHPVVRWKSTRTVYGALGGIPWTWVRTSSNPTAFRAWFETNAAALEQIVFGNHRKYESTRVDVQYNLADVVESYVTWVGPNRGHMLLFSTAFEMNDFDPRRTFAALYDSMKVKRFGRTGRFDYLTMLEKLGVWNIDPPHPYLVNATGPFEGAKLLIFDSRNVAASRSDLSDQVVKIGDFLGVNMQVMEDSLCNWQKSPDIYIPFRG